MIILIYIFNLYNLLDMDNFLNKGKPVDDDFREEGFYIF